MVGIMALVELSFVFFYEGLPFLEYKGRWDGIVSPNCIAKDQNIVWQLRLQLHVHQISPLTAQN
uniref:Uncharacterized protein n=1 Tax=Arundo donax TaxID=35708 RepID=A0A0A9GJR6_ARUDO